MKYYIPIGPKQYLCVGSKEPAHVVQGQHDPFSRVTRPRIKWQKVRSDMPHLTEGEISRARRSKVAYTRLFTDKSPKR